MFNLKVNDDNILLVKINGLPPRIIFTVVIYNDFRVTSYSYNQQIPVKDLLGFLARL